MRALFLTLLAVAAAPALAQSAAITGVVTDSTDAGLPGATVVLTQAADSLIVGFGASKPDGSFQIPRVGPGAYRLQVTYVGYQAATREVALAGEDVDVGRIALAEDLDGLDSLVVTADRAPLVVRQDTLDFDAGAFATPPGSSVEDLLRRLPGVEVDRDGSIEAQGEAVQRVLVDGKEFFGDDPKTATRNLPADAVDRVQIFDKDSETAEFTGVDDGQEERTINLALKDDRRTGWFGQVGGALGGAAVAAGIDAADGARFDGGGTVNRFSPATQLSLIGNANNVSRQDYDVRDILQFSGGMGALQSGGAIVQDVPGLGAAGGDGISTTLSGGINLNHDFGSRTELRSSTFGGWSDADRDRQARRQQVLGTGLASTTEDQDATASQTYTHTTRVDLKHAFADDHDVRLRSSLRTTDSDGASQTRRQTLGPDGTLEADRQTTSDVEAFAPDATAGLTYRRRLGGTRSVVALLEGAYSRPQEDRLLASRDLEGAPPSLPALDQLQTERGTSRSGTASLLLTQPFSGGRALQLDAGRTVRVEDQEQTAVDRPTGETVEALTSAFERTTTRSAVGLTARRTTDALALSASVDLQNDVLEGTARGTGATVRRSDWSLLPAANLEVTFPNDQRLNIAYAASVRQPSLEQLQPVADNRTPLSVAVGNPDLRAETQHALRASVFHFDTFALTNLFAFARVSYTPTAISTARTIDDRLRQTRTPINLGDAWTVSGSARYGTPVRPLGLKVALSASSTLRTQTERLNGVDNASTLTQSTLGLTVENQRKTQFDLQTGVRLAVNTTSYALNPELDERYVAPTLFANASREFGPDWSAEAAFEVERTPADVFGSVQSRPLLSAEVTRRLGDRLSLSLAGTDLLDQGLDIRYASTGGFVQEERTRSLGRTVMLRLSYSLSDVRR